MNISAFLDSSVFYNLGKLKFLLPLVYGRLKGRVIFAKLVEIRILEDFDW